MPERRTYRPVDAFEMTDDGTVYVKSSRDRIPIEYVPAVENCRTCGGRGSIPGFWLGTVKACPACRSRSAPFQATAGAVREIGRRSMQERVARALIERHDFSGDYAHEVAADVLATLNYDETSGPAR